MTEENETLVEYRPLNDDEHKIELGSTALADIHIEYKGIPKEERGGTSVKLLGASRL